MTTLNIGGTKVPVDDAFLTLPPEQQQATVEEITSSLAKSGHKFGAVADDMVQSLGSGLAKGVGMLGGMGGDLQALAARGKAYLPDVTPDPNSVRNAERFSGRGDMGPSFPLPTSEQINSLIQKVTGPFYKPQTTPGQYAETVGEFLPAAGRRVLSMGAIPAIASETAGQVTKGTDLEPWARGGAAFATGGAAALLTRPGTAERAISQQLPQNFNGQTITQAEQLIQEAAARGITLTWPEALERVAPGTGLVNMQRILESTPGGREVMGPVMAQRPGQIEQAARQEFGNIAPPNAEPSRIGPAIGEAAGAEIQGTRQNINAVAEPYYTAARTQPVAQAEMRNVRALPGYEEAVRAIRTDPQLNRYVAGLPENSVGFLNEVKKYLWQAGENAAGPMNANRNMQRAAGYSADEGSVRKTAIDASQRHGGQYETALAIETQGRSQFLDPLLQGPLGKLAANDTTTRKAIDVLFPANPIAGSEAEIARTVTALNRNNPNAARDLVRAHAETTFNEAAQNLQSGANQMGGAKFASAIAGNPQQRANLEAAVTAVGGRQAWNGFDRFLQIMEATGTRQPIGSRTAFNAQELKDLSTGSYVAGGAKLAGAPGKALTVVSDTWSRWQLGQNLEQLARIVTDPNARPILQRIANLPEAATAGQKLAAQLVYMTRAGFGKESNNPPNE